MDRNSLLYYLILSYSLRWRWIVVDICQASKRRGKYPSTAFTDTRWIIVLVYTTQVEKNCPKNYFICNTKLEMIDVWVSRGSMLWGDYNWIITSELANQRAPKALFTCVVYTKLWIIHGRVEIQNISSRVYLYISHVRCAHTWEIELNTRKESRFYSRFKKINPFHAGLRMDKAFAFINGAK